MIPNSLHKHDKHAPVLPHSHIYRTHLCILLKLNIVQPSIPDAPLVHPLVNSPATTHISLSVSAMLLMGIGLILIRRGSPEESLLAYNTIRSAD
jgi:hypothetical protein